MRNSADFAATLRGSRGAASRVVVSVQALHQADLQPVKVGFVVSKSVGNSVARHRIYRQLRHLMRERITGIETGMAIVVRALPPAAQASSAELGADLDTALAKAQKKFVRRAETSVRG